MQLAVRAHGTTATPRPVAARRPAGARAHLRGRVLCRGARHLRGHGAHRIARTRAVLRSGYRDRRCRLPAVDFAPGSTPAGRTRDLPATAGRAQGREDPGHRLIDSNWPQVPVLTCMACSAFTAFIACALPGSLYSTVYPTTQLPTDAMPWQMYFHSSGFGALSVAQNW